MTAQELDNNKKTSNEIVKKDEKVSQKKNKNVSVSAGIIIFRRTEEGIKYLLLYHGGFYWNFPKGKLAEGEKSFKAALREVEEETGIKRKDLVFIDWFKAVDRFAFYTEDKKRINRVIIYYLAETKKEKIIINPREHQGYGWFLLKNALYILKNKNLKNHLRKAERIILSYQDNEKNLPQKRFYEKKVIV